MATMKPTNLQPVCQVDGCKNGAQMYSILGTTASWMKTCRRHTYLDCSTQPHRTVPVQQGN